MKKIEYAFICCLILFISWGMTSCGKTDYHTFDSDHSGIYFVEDSVVYSFGVSVLEITSHVMEIPVRVMGAPVNQKRNFKVEIVSEKTNAEENKHYVMPTELVIEADSVNGFLPLEILRKDLGDDEYWQVGFRLIASDDFIPEAQVGSVTIASFNNIVEPPAWKDWQGKPTWPTYKLGVWAPIKWIKFMEYFRAMEQTVPATYQGMVDMYGPDLEKVQYGWMDEYNYAATKYILTPMYDFFEANPEYGVTIPKPY